MTAPPQQTDAPVVRQADARSVPQQSDPGPVAAQSDNGPVRQSWWQRFKAKFREPDSSFTPIKLARDVFPTKVQNILERRFGGFPADPVHRFPPNKTTIRVPFTNIYLHFGGKASPDQPSSNRRLTWSKHRLSKDGQFLARLATLQLEKTQADLEAMATQPTVEGGRPTGGRQTTDVPGIGQPIGTPARGTAPTTPARAAAPVVTTATAFP